MILIHSVSALLKLSTKMTHSNFSKSATLTFFVIEMKFRNEIRFDDQHSVERKARYSFNDEGEKFDQFHPNLSRVIESCSLEYFRRCLV